MNKKLTVGHRNNSFGQQNPRNMITYLFLNRLHNNHPVLFLPFRYPTQQQSTSTTHSKLCVLACISSSSNKMDRPWNEYVHHVHHPVEGLKMKPFKWRNESRPSLTQVSQQLDDLSRRTEVATRRLEKLSEETRASETAPQDQSWWKRLYQSQPRPGSSSENKS